MIRKYPILGSKRIQWIPWEMVQSHERQAKLNHDQTLFQLAERGGLDCSEVLAVIQDRCFVTMGETDAEAKLWDLLPEWAQEMMAS